MTDNNSENDDDFYRIRPDSLNQFIEWRIYDQDGEPILCLVETGGCVQKIIDIRKILTKKIG